MLVQLNGLLDNLEFKPGTANAFEHSLQQLALWIGFKAQRPEAEYSRGPDVLWEMGQLRFLVIEAKNGVESDVINKKDCNQLNGSQVWFESEYDTTCTGTPVMIHLGSKCERAASPHARMRAITHSQLPKLVQAVREFIQAASHDNNFKSETDIAKLLDCHSLTADKFVDAFTVKVTVVSK